MSDLSRLGTEEEISAAIARVDAAPTVDTTRSNTHYTFHIVGETVSILAHEISQEAPIIGVIRMSVSQWRQISSVLTPAAEASAILPHDGEKP